jgi:hypothetical protein
VAERVAVRQEPRRAPGAPVRAGVLCASRSASMSVSVGVATLGAPVEEWDAWDAAKSSVVVDTLVEAAVVVVVAVVGNCVLVALAGLRTLEAAVR